MNPIESGVPLQLLSTLQLLSALLESSAARRDQAVERRIAEERAIPQELVLAVDADLRVVATNAAMLACLGRDEAAVLGRPLGDVLDVELAMIGPAAEAALKSGRQIVSQETIAPTRGAVPMRYWLSFVPLNAGSIVALVCTARPVVGEFGIDAAMLEASSREQMRLGRDLHDALGQELATTLMLLIALEKRIGDSAPDLMPAAAEIRAAVTQALESMRRIVRGLVPTGLEARGLSRVLAELAARCGRDSKLRVDFIGPEVLPPLPGDAAEHTYRFAQEAISNIVRHARASRVEMRLAIEGSELVLSIGDDGSSFDLEAAGEQGGMGLRIMRYRAQSVGGRLVIETSPVGTRVALRVPLPPQEPEQQ
jgi:two-component sensor histidine kinase